MDDEEANRKLLDALLTSPGHHSVTACDGLEALSKLNGDMDLVLLDVMMPGLDGFEVARRIRGASHQEDIPIVMVTALTSRGDRLRAVVAGADDFITKPIDKVELKIRIASLMRIKDSRDQIRRHKDQLEVLVEKRTAARRKAVEEMAEARRKTHEAHLDTVYRLAIAAEFRDGETGDHITRVEDFTALIAENSGMAEEKVDIVGNAAVLHDVGKIGTPDAILRKPGKHTPGEWEIMKQHTTIGGQILSGSNAELLQAGEIIALSHHEKLGASGYPRGLAGRDIPL